MLRSKLIHSFTIPVSALLLATLCLFSCKKKDDDSATSQFLGEWRGTGCEEQTAKWTEKAPIFSLGRREAVAFSIENEIFVGGGDKKKDFWKYTPETNLWEQLPDIPGSAYWRKDAIGFASGGNGYIGLGTDIGGVLMNDLLQYVPSTNIWTAVEPFPGSPRKGAFCFVVGDSAFVGGGIDVNGNLLSDMYVYVPALNTWYMKSIAPVGIAYASGFSYKHDGFITCGLIESGETNTTYKYNPRADNWVTVASFPGSARQGTSVFTIGEKSYCGLGIVGTSLQQNMFIYNAISNTWSDMEPYPGGPVYFAVATSNNGKGYVGTGGDLTGNYSRWFEYTPKSSNTLNFNLTKGPSNYTLYMKYKIGDDTCAQEVKLLGTISSNTIKDNFSVGTQSFVDKCGNNYSISGAGSLVGDSIFITTLTSSTAGTNACTFKGAK